MTEMEEFWDSEAQMARARPLPPRFRFRPRQIETLDDLFTATREQATLMLQTGLVASNGEGADTEDGRVRLYGNDTFWTENPEGFEITTLTRQIERVDMATLTMPLLEDIGLPGIPLYLESFVEKFGAPTKKSSQAYFFKRKSGALFVYHIRKKRIDYLSFSWSDD